LGLGVMVHQRIRIGPGAMVGMGAIVTRNLPPYSLSVGNPARRRGANIVGLTRAGYPAEVADLVAAYLEVSNPETLSQLPNEIKAAFEEYHHLGAEA
ncbi:MAG TPA: acyl-ACP--UDP-N- acetylglucosamine O-acyltransferase, partial [Mycobacteriales bacterium]|nr:acyl-ACP--UDP-N- acetylglucosamine O-acyltransferase [Mycobacteriales bacterium]